METDLNDLSNELSASTLAALSEFLADQRGAEENKDPFAENWAKSQFWYDDTTAATVANEVKELSTCEKRVACLACPSLFRALKEKHPDVNAQIFEYDQRFSVFGERFTFYDYNEPLAVPMELHHAFDIVIADPPYLSEECLAKTAETMKLLSKNPETPVFILLTGAVQHERAKLYLGARPCKFKPQHRSKLGNEFSIFTNYPSNRLGGWED